MVPNDLDSILTQISDIHKIRGIIKGNVDRAAVKYNLKDLTLYHEIENSLSDNDKTAETNKVIRLRFVLRMYDYMEALYNVTDDEIEKAFDTLKSPEEDVQTFLTAQKNKIIDCLKSAEPNISEGILKLDSLEDSYYKYGLSYNSNSLLIVAFNDIYQIIDAYCFKKIIAESMRTGDFVTFFPKVTGTMSFFVDYLVTKVFNTDFPTTKLFFEKNNPPLVSACKGGAHIFTTKYFIFHASGKTVKFTSSVGDIFARFDNLDYTVQQGYLPVAIIFSDQNDNKESVLIKFVNDWLLYGHDTPNESSPWNAGDEVKNIISVLFEKKVSNMSS